MITIAHLSDPHFGGKPSAANRSTRILEHLASMDPPVDVVLVTGDIADHGHPDEYSMATTVLGAWPGPAPMLFLPGNHDVRPEYVGWLEPEAAQPPQGPLRPHHQVHRVAGASFLMLDSLVPAPPGERIDHGELDSQSLAWIDSALGACPAEEPAFICLHHPPVAIHQARMDGIRLRAEDAVGLAKVLARHAHVKAVFCGHAHTACATTFGQIPVLVGGGAASAITLEAEQLPFITDALPPSFAFHLIDEDGHLVTHWRTV